MNIDLTTARAIITEWAESHPVTIDFGPLELADEHFDSDFIPIDVNSTITDTASYCFNLHADGIIRNAEYDEDTDEEEHDAFELVIDSLLHRLNDVFGVRTVKGLFLDAATDTDSGRI